MLQEIKTRQTSAYGTIFVYPVCEMAIKFTTLTGRKTFTHSDLCVIESMGYTINCINQPAKA